MEKERSLENENKNENSILKCDIYHKEIIKDILENGTLDVNPRPVYDDGVDENGERILTPAHTLSVNHVFETYDLTKGELPIITLRPIAVKSAIAELLWIYQMESNNLDDLAKLGVTWWNSWDIGDRTIGACYGETVRRHNLMHNLLNGLKKDPYGRRHIINMWQEDDFKDKHGLKPCCYQTQFSVVNGKDKNGNCTNSEEKDYLDCILYQRSSDFCTAGVINAFQYCILLYLVARHCGYIPRKFSIIRGNVQIYDRHIKQAKELLSREPIACKPEIWINPDKTDFYTMTLDDIKLVNYPRSEIKEKNPQLKFPLAI